MLFIPSSIEPLATAAATAEAAAEAADASPTANAAEVSGVDVSDGWALPRVLAAVGGGLSHDEKAALGQDTTIDSGLIDYSMDDDFSTESSGVERGLGTGSEPDDE